MSSRADVDASSSSSLFFVHDPPATHIYTLSLHDALPISAAGARTARHRRHHGGRQQRPHRGCPVDVAAGRRQLRQRDRKSTRLNSSHLVISYAVFCLKKKTTDTEQMHTTQSKAHTLNNKQ